jgi:hypothetical protein
MATSCVFLCMQLCRVFLYNWMIVFVIIELSCFRVVFVEKDVYNCMFFLERAVDSVGCWEWLNFKVFLLENILKKYIYFFKNIF